MKRNIKLFLFFTLLCICKSFAQVSTTITDVFVNNQTTINNCGVIGFGSVSNNSLAVHFKLTKPSAQAIGNCNLKILLKYSNGTAGSQKANIIV